MWLVDNPGEEAVWNPKFTLGALKPHICSFVEVGWAACKTPAMKKTIADSFLSDGCFETIRSEVRQAQAAIDLLAKKPLNFSTFYQLKAKKPRSTILR